MHIIMERLGLAGNPIICKEVKSKTQEYRPFIKQEIDVLIEDGVVILDLTEETIEDQQKAGRPFGYVSARGDILLKAPSIKTQVAIFRDPEKFFVPNTGWKGFCTRPDLSSLEDLTKIDAEKLRERTGLEDLDEIIPSSASTLTELTFKYFDRTTKEGKGVWLFGRDYGFRYGRTNHPMNRSDAPEFFRIGFAGGVVVDYLVGGCGPDRIYVHVARLIVAKKK